MKGPIGKIGQPAPRAGPPRAGSPDASMKGPIGKIGQEGDDDDSILYYQPQ